MTADVPPRGDLRRRVLAGESTVGAFVGLGAPASAELIARAGYDWAILDLEHGMGSVADLHAQLLAVQTTPTAALVRVPSVERLRIDRALDLGADGVMLPQVRTVAEARDGVSWMRYPPAGVRGVALFTRGAGYGAVDHPDVAARVNESLLGVFQVESPEAVAAADDLAAIDGVDVLFVGPADLSHSMGIPGQHRPSGLHRRPGPGHRRHAAGTARRRGSCSATVRRSRRRTRAGSRSSASGRTSRSSSPAPAASSPQLASALPGA